MVGRHLGSGEIRLFIEMGAMCMDAATALHSSMVNRSWVLIVVYSLKIFDLLGPCPFSDGPESFTFKF